MTKITYVNNKFAHKSNDQNYLNSVSNDQKNLQNLKFDISLHFYN